MSSSPITLVPNLDIRAAAPLRDALLARSGDPVSFDASRVVRIGGLCLQVLIAGARDWRERGVSFSIQNPTPAFLDTIELFGAATTLAPNLAEGAP